MISNNTCDDCAYWNCVLSKTPSVKSLDNSKALTNETHPVKPEHPV